MLSGVQNIFFIISLAFFLWLSGLTVVFWKLLSHYKRVAKRVPEGDLIKVINRVLEQEKSNIKDINKLENEIKRLDNDLLKPVQKVGVIRFNPFNEIGGDHSFVICLLDREDNGFVLTGLHTRDRTRVYLKEVIQGESKIDLSEEERKAVRETKRK